ncbi:MAG: DUF2249 domain-containing protein [Halococcoides sp.]
MPPEAVLEQDSVPDRSETVRLDVRDLPPPEPLQKTLETLSSLDDAILIQINDRAPQHLFPKVEERGFDHESVGDGPVYTAIWMP